MGFSGGISFSGLSSGLDTDSIIAAILRVEQLPLQRLQFERLKLSSELSSVDQYKALIEVVRAAVKELNSASAFNPIKAVSSDSEVATISATSTAQAGTFNLAVSKLAQTHKLGSSAQTDATSALGLNGTFLVNGKAITVEASDSLTAIASEINSTNAGVTASIINGGDGNVFLTLTSEESGVDNAIALSDVSTDTVLDSLGFLTGSATIRKPITNGAQSIGFTDNVTAIGTLLGITVPSGTIQINGENIAIDFSTDSLTDIAAAITASAAGVTATVVSEEVNGVTIYKMEIVGASTPTFTDANNILESLGILQRPAGNELLAAQDAEFTLDGISLTSASNTVIDVITGVTLTLLKADETTPETATLTLSRDTAAIRDKVGALADAYNAVLDFLDQAASFDSDTLASGPLFGNSTVRQVQNLLFNGLLGSPEGITGDFANLLAIGIDFDSDGRMSLDAAAFDEAIASDLDNVKALFMELGTINDQDITFVSATSKTVPGTYEIIITQLATQAQHTAGTAFTGTSAVTETLTFNGDLFNDTDYFLTVNAGTTLDDLINLINNDTKLKDKVTASKTGSDELVITSKNYGTPGSFTVVSSLTAASDNSGIGDTLQTVDGLDVLGTINGEAATSSGQFLTGGAGASDTEGLQILVSGGPLGSRGFITYTKGAAAVMEDALDAALDFVSGFITADQNSIQDEIDDIDDRITQIGERLASREATLQRKFAALENAMSQLQFQMAQLSSMLSGLQQPLGGTQ